jgi:hypothetical protein
MATHFLSDASIPLGQGIPASWGRTVSMAVRRALRVVAFSLGLQREEATGGGALQRGRPGVSDLSRSTAAR